LYKKYVDYVKIIKVLEAIMKKGKNNLVEKLKENKSIKMVSLVKYNGEYIIEQ
jgi:dihydroneopterin aldolase